MGGNMKNLRLVVLDYPKIQIDNPQAKQLLVDMIQSKQKNFERADENYVPMNGLDMISTHFMIYDCTDMYNPKPVLAIRNCYGDRTQKHKLKLPSEEYILHAPKEYQERYYQFKEEKKFLVDCNAWFVDPSYSYKNTGLRLSEIAYFMLVSHTIRRGFDHWVGATNERFKASRWAELTGRSPQGMIFNHPQVDDPHKLLLIDPIDYDWVLKTYQMNKDLYSNRYEVRSEKNEEFYMSESEFENYLYSKSSGSGLGLSREVSSVMTESISS